VNRDFQPDRILGILGELNRTASDYASREAQTKRDLSIRKSRIKRLFEQSSAAIRERLRAAVEVAEAALEERKPQIEAKYAGYAERAVEAHKGARREAFEAARRRGVAVKVELEEAVSAIGSAHRAKAAKAREDCERMEGRLAALSDGLDTMAAKAQRLFRNLGPRVPASEQASDGPADDDIDVNAGPELVRFVEERLQTVQDSLIRFEHLAVPRLFNRVRMSLLTFFLVACHVGVFFGLHQLRLQPAMLLKATGSSLLLFLALAVVLYLIARRQAKPFAASVFGAIPEARRTHDLGLKTAGLKLATELARFADERNREVAATKTRYEPIEKEAGETGARGLQSVDEKRDRLLAKMEQHCRKAVAAAEQELAAEIGRLKERAEHELEEAAKERDRETEECLAEEGAAWAALIESWRADITPAYEAVASASRAGKRLFPEWGDPCWADWSPPHDFASSVPFGRLAFDVAELGGGVPQDKRLPLPGPSALALPTVLTFPEQCSLLLETWAKGRETAIQALNNVMLRLLTAAPPGKVNFTLIDPVGLGQSFAAFMHLTDYEESLVGGRIWTEPRQIEHRLADLNEHMEKVIQMYLRNEYETISEYNRNAGEVAERYRYLVIADFPANFSDEAARRLLSIVSSGARCGVYTLISWDRRHSLPADFAPEELRKNCLALNVKGEHFAFPGTHLKEVVLTLEKPPPPDVMTDLLHKVGQASRDSTRVEVPFGNVVPPEAEWWTGDMTSELSVPIGRSGATKLQCLTLGKGTLQHALIAGKTGSGKSTLLHVLVTSLSLWYGPDEVEFYLVDFKKGVEFKPYATQRLPHARAIAIESDREFGLSVLHRVDQELKRRGTLFRDAGVQDLKGYRGLADAEPVPRTLLIIDEFQEYFVEDDRVSQSAALLLDRIVRQGRAFGIHVLLGSQTLGGAYTLARATLGQMAVRIALQCSEADSYLILSEENAAARLLSRPGEAIYNDAAGLEEGNSPFQVVWLPDAEREKYLERIRAKAAQEAYSPREPPIVFEGNAPADIGANADLRKRLDAPLPDKPPTGPCVWLGEPNAIKGPTAAVFRRQAGANLLIVGQRDEAALAMLALSLVGLAAQHPAERARFVLLDSSGPDTPPAALLKRLASVPPQQVLPVKQRDLTEAMNELAGEIDRRQDLDDALAAPSVYVIVYGLHQFRKLRYEEDFSFSVDDAGAEPDPGRQFSALLREGPSLGLHVIAWCDTLNNVNRTFSRRGLSEFEMRVLFQMSAADSSSLIDTPEASDLGLHRALFYNEQEGTLEKFRPYSLPTTDWLDAVKVRLAGRG